MSSHSMCFASLSRRHWIFVVHTYKELEFAIPESFLADSKGKKGSNVILWSELLTRAASKCSPNYLSISCFGVLPSGHCIESLIHR
jgi:hypothetical protein